MERRARSHPTSLRAPSAKVLHAPKSQNNIMENTAKHAIKYHHAQTHHSSAVFILGWLTCPEGGRPRHPSPRCCTPGGACPPKWFCRDLLAVRNINTEPGRRRRAEPGGRGNGSLVVVGAAQHGTPQRVFPPAERKKADRVRSPSPGVGRATRETRKYDSSTQVRPHHW